MSSGEWASRSGLDPSTTWSTSSEQTQPKICPYDAAFEQHLIDHDIYPHGYEYLDDRIPPRPNDWEEIKQALVQPRPPLSPSRFSDEAFRAFQNANLRAYDEPAVMGNVLPIIAGNANIPSRKNVQYTKLEPITDNTITALKPDFYDGDRPATFDRRVRKPLGPYIVPSENLSHPALPNFFLEVKGPSGRVDVMKRQVCYDGAVGARGMLHAHSYRSGGAMEYDGNAYTVITTYHDGQLKIYTTHPTQPATPGGRRRYHMTQLRTFSMVDSVESFREAAGAFRNARDWAKKQRDHVISVANQVVQFQHLQSHVARPLPRHG